MLTKLGRHGHWARDDPLDVVNFCCRSDSGCGSRMTFPLSLTLRDRVFTVFSRICDTVIRYSYWWIFLQHGLCASHTQFNLQSVVLPCKHFDNRRSNSGVQDM